MTGPGEPSGTDAMREEIAGEALRQSDRGAEPTIGSLAEALSLSPSAISEHFPSQAAVTEAAVESVWVEVEVEGYGLMPDPTQEDPAELLVAAAVATRRVWLRHPQLTPYLAATPDGGGFMSRALPVFANVFERLGLEPPRAAACFHSYASFVVGAVMFATARQRADAELAEQGRPEHHAEGFRTAPEGEFEGLASAETLTALERAMDLSRTDPERDEELFANGLRRLIAGFARDGGE